MAKIGISVLSRNSPRIPSASEEASKMRQEKLTKLCEFHRDDEANRKKEGVVAKKINHCAGFSAHAAMEDINSYMLSG